MSKATSKTDSLRPLTIALVLLVSFFALVMQTWVVLRLPLWSDELDHINTALLPWRGGRSFWWLLGQFNANPPGDNLIIRGLYQSGLLNWVQVLSPELFWRFYHLFLYFLTPLIAFWGSFKYTKSLLLGFVAYIFMLTSPGLFLYASEARFYTSLVFYMTCSIWLFFLSIDTGKKHYFFILCFVTALGVMSHLMMAAVGYLVLVYSFILTYNHLKKVKASSKTLHKHIALVGAGFLPFIIYKIALKHWVFISRPYEDARPLQALLNINIEKSILTPILSSLYLFGAAKMVLIFILLALTVTFIRSFIRKDHKNFLTSGLLLTLLLGTPIAIFYSAAARKYDLGQRHFLYTVPLFCCALIFLMNKLKVYTQKIPVNIQKLVSAAILISLSFYTLSFLQQSAYGLRDFSQAKSTYPLVKWRSFYQQLPDRRQLVIVGSAPDNASATSDIGTFRAGHMVFYAGEFNPWYYSTKGSFNAQSLKDPALAEKIESNPEKYDFLILDGREAVKRILPKIAWKSLTSEKCTDYKNMGNADLSFCRP